MLIDYGGALIVYGLLHIDQQNSGFMTNTLPSFSICYI